MSVLGNAGPYWADSIHASTTVLLRSHNVFPMYLHPKAYHGNCLATMSFSCFHVPKVSDDTASYLTATAIVTGTPFVIEIESVPKPTVDDGTRIEVGTVVACGLCNGIEVSLVPLSKQVNHIRWALTTEIRFRPHEPSFVMLHSHDALMIV